MDLGSLCLHYYVKAIIGEGALEAPRLSGCPSPMRAQASGTPAGSAHGVRHHQVDAHALAHPLPWLGTRHEALSRHTLCGRYAISIWGRMKKKITNRLNTVPDNDRRPLPRPTSTTNPTNTAPARRARSRTSAAFGPEPPDRPPVANGPSKK